MAKYKDPNTGIKYSTHTGLKVFTVIVVILLVISIVFNVALYMQNSDDSTLDSNESGELDGQDGDGRDGQDEDGDSSEGGATAEPGEGIVDTETVIEKELGNGYYGVELSEGYAVRTSEFREHGAATCLYYYPDEHWGRENGEEFEGCAECDGPCEGHEYWITKNGVVYKWSYYMEPDVRTQVLTAEDDSTDINSKIRFSLVFNGHPEDEYGYSEYVEYTDYYYTKLPYAIEIASLTDEPLEIESIEMRQYVYYEDTSSNPFSVIYKEFHSTSGIEVEVEDYALCVCPDVTTVYRDGGAYGEFSLTLTLSDESSYLLEYWVIPYPDKMIGAEVVYVD